MDESYLTFFFFFKQKTAYEMAIGWRQFDSVLSNFRQGGWGYTTDAGITWNFPGVLEDNVFRSDPVLYSDETGKFFISVSWKRFVMTFGARAMGHNPGSGCH